MCSIPGLPSPGSTVTVFITRVNVNPLCVLVEFWGNFVQDQKLAYQQMKKEIQYPKEVFHEGEGKPGDLCLVRVYETWYRGRIVSRNDTYYSVFLIDEGRTLRAHTSLLAWGQTDFFNLPPEVEFCILSNVLPLSTENRWSKLALGFMKSFCGRSVTACVLDFAIPQRAFLLDIPCLSRQMHEMGFAKKLSSEEFKDFVSRSLQSDAGSVDLLRTASMGFEPLVQIKKQQCYMYPELQAETTETVLVTEVNNPLRVFCQLKVFSQELKKLTEQITKHYERTIGSHFARPENLGAPCASRGTDGKWYRSVLQQVMSTNNVVEVLHVDYGKKQFVQVDHVRPLAPEFFRMPVVTYVCSLHGVIDRGVGWTVSQIDYLKSLLLNRTVIARFEYQSLSEGVHYVTLYGDENTNINKLFGSREKCLMDSRCLKDYTVHKMGTRQRCQISVKGETQGTEDLKGIFTESLSPNTEHVAVVQHVDSPSKFWIQTQKYAAEFDLLMNGLTELYSDQTRTSGVIRKPVAGLLCVAKAQDDVFYRATICEVIESKAEVFFLDYGNKELVDCSNLCELPLRYQNLPALAIKCALYGIQPGSEEWDLNATLFFAKAVVDKVLDVRILAKSEDTHLVQVIDSMSDGEKDFSKLLCNAGFADFEAMDKPMVAPYTKVVQTSDVFKTGAVSQSSSSPAVTAAFKEYLFPIGSSFDVTVSYIESPNDFWCQKTTDAKCLKLLMQDLQRYYANSEFQPPLEAACVARHPENRMWSRALVIQKHQASNVTVLFVDYGETKRVPIHDLRRIDPEFLKLKGQAFRCCLYNLSYPVSHSPLVWSPDATLQFREFVDKAASMSVMLKCTVYAVMCDTQKVIFNVVDLESPFQSLCRLLVQRGLADSASKMVALPPLRLDTYYYSSHSIKTGSEEDVCITYVKNVNQFFCHLQRNSVQIEELADKVNRLCGQLQRINCPKTFGNVCFAKYTDGLWYRGQFKSVKPPVVVHFVDYGDTQQVEKSDLLPVPVEAAEIMAIPVQAVECGLSDVPEKVPGEVNNWFESFVMDRKLKALIVAKEPTGKLIVELYDGKTPVNAIIREKFHIEVERNEQITVKEFDVMDQYRSYSVPERQKVPQWTPEKHWRSQKNADSEESSGRFLDGDMKRDITAIKLKQHVFHRDSHSESENEKPSVLKQAELPVKVVEPGLEAEVFISHCNSPLSFFVQLVTDESDIWSLVEKLNDGQSEHVPVNSGDLCEGDLVSAEYPDDNCWYRAVVRKAPVGDTADVEFIDFGNTAEVSVSKICILDKMFSQPRYSIHCSLIGVENVDCDVASNLKTEMEKNADGFLCKFIQQAGSVWEVKLEVNGKLLGSALSKDASNITVTAAPKSPDTNFNLCTYKNPDIPTGQVIAVYASVIIGPQLFWCQYAETEKLQEISDIIQKIGSNLESGALNVETLQIGSGCIALFDEDQLWYRAKVTSVEKDTLSVLFVDYGNESKVKMSDVRPLPFEVSDLPPQAFACQLDGFNVLEGSWDDKAADQFFELINDHLLKVTILKLASSCDMVTPHFVKLECEEIIINDAVKKCWTQNSKRTSFELANAPSATLLDSTTVTETSSLCVSEPVVRPKDPLCAMEYLHNGTCISPLRMQVECDSTLAEHEEQAGSTELLDKRNVAVGTIFSQDDDHDLTSAGIEKTENYGKSVGVKDTNVNVDISDIHSNQPVDVLGECQLDSTDFMSKGAFTGSLEYTDENEVVETAETASPEVPSCDEVCEKVYRSVSEHEEHETESDHEIIKSDLGNVRRAAESNVVGSECVIWSHVHKGWCRAQTLKISDDSTLVLLLDHDFVMKVDPVNIFEIVPEESLQVEKEMEHEAVTCFASQDPSVIDRDEEIDEERSAGMDVVVSDEQAQDKEHDSCLGDLVAESEKTLQVDLIQCLDLNAPQEMSQMFVADVSLEQSEPAMEMDLKLELAQNACGASTVQEQTEETSPPAEEQRVEDVIKTCEQVDELMDFIPVIPLEKDQEAQSEAETHVETFSVMSQEKAKETEHETVECFSSQEPTGFNEEMDEQPSGGVDLVIIEEQAQDKEHDSYSGDLVAESEKPVQDDATQGPDLGLDTPQEMSKKFVADVSVEQSEPDMEMNPSLEVAQDLCCAVKVQVQPAEDTEETSPPVEEQGVEDVTKMCEQVDELMEFIPVIPLEKDQEAESEAETHVETFSVMSQEKALDVELDADPDLAAVIEVIDDVIAFVSENEQGSDTTSDMIKVSMVQTECLAADTVSSDVQQPSDAEELRALMVTHLSLRIEDTSDDDIIFVKEWQVSATETIEPSSKE
ncbi:tudor domain-containing 6 isoform X2 [Pangasianodon hypophthalmus]|uniref:tudor domain-containing 6 isoform X2 n=1 Tax=Pangasianodon hypophthalmus TaxID=310915 RepID=UPI002307B29E|nr:tudor domain-containing 6 isoform X2 [Pangasianodon hypophthalmus]